MKSRCYKVIRKCDKLSACPGCNSSAPCHPESSSGCYGKWMNEEKSCEQFSASVLWATRPSMSSIPNITPPHFKALLTAWAFREITSLSFSQFLVQSVSTRTRKQRPRSAPALKQAPQGATKSQGPNLFGKQPPPPLRADTPCSNWQPNSPASYPAAPWQPQPLHMLCPSSSHWHLAEPPRPATPLRPNVLAASGPALRREATRVHPGRSAMERAGGCGSVPPPPHRATPPGLPPLPVWLGARPHPPAGSSGKPMESGAEGRLFPERCTDLYMRF